MKLLKNEIKSLSDAFLNSPHTQSPDIRGQFIQWAQEIQTGEIHNKTLEAWVVRYRRIMAPLSSFRKELSQTIKESLSSVEQMIHN